MELVHEKVQSPKKRKQLKLSSSLGLIVASKGRNQVETAVKKRGRPPGSVNKLKNVGKVKQNSNLQAKLKGIIHESVFSDKKRPKPQAKASAKIKEEIEGEINGFENLDQINNNDENMVLVAINDNNNEAIPVSGDNINEKKNATIPKINSINPEQNMNGGNLKMERSEILDFHREQIMDDHALSEANILNTENLEEPNICSDTIDPTLLNAVEDLVKASAVGGNSNNDGLSDDEVEMEDSMPKSPGQSWDSGRQLFKCKNCTDKWFPNRYFLRKHRLIYHEDQLYECRVCSFNSVDPEKLKYHIIKMHVEKKEKAESSFVPDTLNEMDESMQSTRTVIMEDGVHLGRDLSSRTRFMCDLCNRVYMNKFSLERHVRCHTLEKPFVCTVCPFQSSYREHMMRHMTSVHLIVHSKEPKLKYIPKHPQRSGKENENCDGDGDQLENESSPNSDLKQKRRNIIRKRFECAVCGLKSTHKSDLRSHIQSKHPNAHIESMENNDGSKVHLIVSVAKKAKPRKKLTIECGFCSLIFHDTWKYKVHMRSHTGVKPFRCSVCDMKASSKMTVRDHIHRKHPDAVDPKIMLCTISIDGKPDEIKIDVPHREFRCDVCQELFKDNYNLKQHKSTSHPTALPFLCLVCNFRALTKSAMLIHFVENHKEESPENSITRKGRAIKTGALKVPTCELCGKLFSYRSQLRQHMMNHMGDKKFSCEHCEYKSNIKQYLADHVEKKHLGVNKKKTVNKSKGLKNIRKDSIKSPIKVKMLRKLLTKNASSST